MSETRKKWRRNDGLRKVCGCPRRKWTKCSHPWHVNAQINGQNIRKSLGRKITSKTDAEAELENLRVRLRDGAFDESVPSDITLADMLNRYHKTVVASTASAANILSQIGIISRTVLPKGPSAVAFGLWPVADIDLAAIWAYRTARQIKAPVLDKDGQPVKRKNGAASRRTSGGVVGANREIKLMRAAFNWAKGALAAQVRHSPFDAPRESRKRLLVREEPRDRRLRGDEGDRLMAACGASLRPIVEAALETAMRRGEILGLQWRDLELGTEKPAIRLPAEKTKTRRPRTIPISARLKPMLELRQLDAEGKKHKPDAYVFGHPATGERMKSIKTAWGRAVRKAKIDGLHFHDLRREAASRWLEAGVSLKSISTLLGHKTTQQTATYLADALNAEHDAIAKYDAHRERLQVLASQAATGVTNGVNGGLTRDTSPQDSSANPVVH